MPSSPLLEALKKAKISNPKLADEIKSDVKKAQENLYLATGSINPAMVSRIANNIPNYLTDEKINSWVEEFTELLKVIEFVAKDKSDPRSVEELKDDAKAYIYYDANDPSVLEKDIYGKYLQPGALLEMDEASADKLNAFYQELLKEIATQIIIVTSSVGAVGAELNPQFIEEAGIKEVIKSMQVRDLPFFQAYLIQSLANNIIVSKIQNITRSLTRDDIDLNMRFLICDKDLCTLTQNRTNSEKAIDQVVNESASLLHRYAHDYIINCGHNKSNMDEILAHAFFKEDILKSDPIKQRSQKFTMFSTEKNQQHELGDRILSYAGERYPEIAKTIYKKFNSAYEHESPEVKVFALKALVRLNRADLAYKVLHHNIPKEMIPKGKDLLDAVSERKIRKFLKADQKRKSKTPT